ncbi:aldehyde dehydrogenase PuuC (plasmid) [Saccharobesus litoralis]|uniref:Aldehyde dehydrogenase PuuC n=1 Tax=Saccharobesus litoralis TaxID=2172099 RepID=A0A2S0VY79_9ALTE|nr:aldehyde dehydrogenase family protein [Saccharobesus litoralis]AWB69148.1 aldehyde dehydrogenase PuuC [Saccharobesus litoralis]
MHNTNWHQLAADFNPNTTAVIDGHAYPVTSARQIEKVSPVDGRALPSVGIGSQADVDHAVSVARAAFEDKRWSGLDFSQRRKILLKFADLIDAATTELALMDCLEMGKCIENLVNDDIPVCAESIRWYAQALDKVFDYSSPARDGAMGTVTHEPLGVVTCIVPFNYPMIMAAWKIGPALAMGNSVILKPGDRSCYSAIKLAELAIEAGIPPGVFNVLPGDGSTGQALALHMDIDGIFFTGSTETGKKIMQYAGQSNMKRLALECGGKSPFVVLKSCRQLPFAAQTLARHLFFNQGQICSAASRLIIDSEIADEFIPLLLEQAQIYQPADPLDITSRVGASHSIAHLSRVQAYVDQAIEQGAELLVGGKVLNTVSGGAYYAPTILTNVSNDMTIAREEVFGPVLSIIKVASEQEAVAVANDTIFGLAAGVWSDDFSSAHRVAHQLKAGSVHVNSWGEDDATAPFGGIKQSGMGKDKSILALHQYANVKNTWFKY